MDFEDKVLSLSELSPDNKISTRRPNKLQYSRFILMLRKLDIELEKFRIELEADNSGITEQIEKKCTG
ncbi:unnamed protein product [Schistosoma spindalis]|nr:unnamed protein product [Schistosoma spindale]